MTTVPIFPTADSFPRGDYRLINATIPSCLLDAKHGGDSGSDALVAASLTIVGGKIRQIDIGMRAGLTVADGLPEIDLDSGMVWPLCVDLHTHLDKGQIW